MWRFNWSVKNAKENGDGAAVQFALWTGSGLVDALVIVLASCQRFKHHYMPGARTPPIPLCSSARAGIGCSLSVTVAALKASTSYPYFQHPYHNSYTTYPRMWWHCVSYMWASSQSRWNATHCSLQLSNFACPSSWSRQITHQGGRVLRGKTTYYIHPPGY